MTSTTRSPGPQMVSSWLQEPGCFPTRATQVAANSMDARCSGVASHICDVAVVSPNHRGGESSFVVRPCATKFGRGRFSKGSGPGIAALLAVASAGPMTPPARQRETGQRFPLAFGQQADRADRVWRGHFVHPSHQNADAEGNGGSKAPFAMVTSSAADEWILLI